MNQSRKENSRPTTVRPMRKTDIDDVVRLHEEFELYLKEIEHERNAKTRIDFHRILELDGFGRNRSFRGFVAISDRQLVGYVLLFIGYDPDEMRGRCVYVIDLFVTQGERRKGVGRKLMNKVASESSRVSAAFIYIGVWSKNSAAASFYKKLGATRNDEFQLFQWRVT